MGAEFDKFSQAMSRQKAAADRIAAIRKQLSLAQVALTHPEAALVTNIDGFGFGSNALIPSSPRIDAQQWPKIDELAGAISEFQKATEAARDAWANVPSSERSHLVKPSFIHK